MGVRELRDRLFGWMGGYLVENESESGQGKSVKISVFVKKSLQCKSFANLKNHFPVEIIDVFWFFGTLGAQGTC